MGVNEGVNWLDAPVIVLLWVAVFSCLIGAAELRSPYSWKRSRSGPPRQLDLAAALGIGLLFMICLFALLFLLYQAFGILLLLVPAFTFPLVLVALAVWSPLENMSTYRTVRACLIVLVISLLAAVLWHATMAR